MLEALLLNSDKTPKKTFELKSDAQNEIGESPKESLFFSLLSITKEGVQKKDMPDKKATLINAQTVVQEPKQDNQKTSIVLKNISSKTKLEDMLQRAEIKNEGGGVSLKELFKVAKKSDIEIQKVEITGVKDGENRKNILVLNDKESKKIVVKKEQIEPKSAQTKEEELPQKAEATQKVLKTEDRYKTAMDAQKTESAKQDIKEQPSLGLKEALALKKEPKEEIKQESTQVNDKKEPKSAKSSAKEKEHIVSEQKEQPKVAGRKVEQKAEGKAEIKVDTPKQSEPLKDRDEKELKNEIKKEEVVLEPKKESSKKDEPRVSIESPATIKKDETEKKIDKNVKTVEQIKTDKKEEIPTPLKETVEAKKEDKNIKLQEPQKFEKTDKEIESEQKSDKYKTEQKDTHVKDEQKIESGIQSKKLEEKSERTAEALKHKEESIKEGIRQGTTQNGGEGKEGSKEGYRDNPKEEKQKDKNTNKNSETSEDKTSEKTNTNTIKSDFSTRVAEAKESIRYLSDRLKEEIESYKSPFKKINLELNPRNLGTLDVTMVTRGNNLHVTLSSNAQALIMLAQNMGDFRNNLINLGFGNVVLNFSGNGESNNGSGGQRGGHQNERNKNSLYINREDDKSKKSTSLELIIPRYI